MYVLFNNPDYFNKLKDCHEFIRTFEYTTKEIQNTSQSEWGKLNLRNGNYLHLIFDTGRENNCPWCDCPEPIIKQVKLYNPGYEMFYCQCPKCGARGPILNVNESALIEEEVEKEYKNYCLQRWIHRIPRRIDEQI